MSETNPTPRWILHCDCNSFFANVELLEHPELRNVPVAVCGDPEGRHGIVLAKNEAAKKFKIQTAETIWSARQKCPNLQLLPPHHAKYRHYYNIINGIYQEYTVRVEPFSIDESWLDVTNTWQLYAESPAALADQLRARVKQTTGLTISVGVSFNKVFAKMGSDYKKPDATTLISRENYRDILWPLPVGELLFVGKSARERLAAMGIFTIGDLARTDVRLLTQALGKLGAELSRYARGEDTAEVRRWGESEPVKSIGNGMTFRRDLTTPAEIRAGLTSLSDEVAGRLRRHGLYAGAVQVTIKGTDLKSIQRQKQLAMSTHLARDLANESLALVQANWPAGRPIRMLTVTALHLTDLPMAVQQSLFEDAPKADPKREALEKSLDAIRKKYGKHAIAGASAVNSEIGLSGLTIDEASPAGSNESADGRQLVKGPRET
ncbi:MAG: DNA polymerase IV [Faecalibacterium sp.]|nr:DNA polymerase IV [Faecalibacterium sp.]